MEQLQAEVTGLVGAFTHQRQELQQLTLTMQQLQAEHNAWTHANVDTQQRVTAMQAALLHSDNTFGEHSRRMEALMGSTMERVAKVEDRGVRGAAASSNTAAFQRNPLVDPKHLQPETFSGAKGVTWRD